MRSPLGSLINRAPVPYAPRSGGGGLRLPFVHRSDREAQLRAMGGVGTLFAIVNRQAKAVGGTEWKLYRKAKSGKKEDRVEVTSHAALDLWRAPNPYFNGQVFAEAGAQHKLLTGEQWWVIARSERAGKLPLEMWPVRPDRIEPVPDADAFLLGYMYYGPGGEQVALNREDVIFIRTPNPIDAYRGLGPVQSILMDIDATRYSAEWNRNFFLNSAEPGGIIEVPGDLSDPEFDQLRTRWNEQHKGVANAHRVAILEHGKWVDRKYTQRDMQFVELRNVAREVIREAYGFPKAMLGSTEDVNRANAEAGEHMFARWLIVPELDAIKAALNRELLPMYGRTAEGLEFDYTNPVPEDEELEGKLLTARAGAAKSLNEAGYDPDDVLSTVGLPAMRHGQASAEQPAAGRPQAASAWGRATRHLTAAGDDDQEDAHLAEIRHAFDTALAELLREWEAEVLPGWCQSLEQQVREAVDADDTEGLVALSLETADAARLLRLHLAGMAEQAAHRVVAEAADQGVSITAPDLDEALTAVLRRDYRNAFGGELVEIAAATVSLLASGLAGAAAREALRLFRPGESDGPTVASRVGEFVRGLSDRFRRDNLGGALHRAQNTARLAAMEEGQRQVTSVTFHAAERLDLNTCDPCDDVDGREFATVVEARAAYGGGGYVDCRGGVRCRGTVTATWR